VNPPGNVTDNVNSASELHNVKTNIDKGKLLSLCLPNCTDVWDVGKKLISTYTTTQFSTRHVFKFPPARSLISNPYAIVMEFKLSLS
jgi:hypothetical protein